MIKKDNAFTLIGLAMLSGVLLFLAWPPLHFNFIIFIGFIPLLRIEEQLRANYPRTNIKFLSLSFLAFLSWNILATWWIWNSSGVGCILAIVCNSMLMTLPMFFFHKIKRVLSKTAAYIALCAFWILFEYCHLNWDGNWPWLNLGNVWASTPDWVQWYEYTGALGGTLWVLIVNICFYELIVNFSKDVKRPYFRLLVLCALIAIPVIISSYVKPEGLALAEKENVVAVQPNIDPYNEKFSGNIDQQIAKLIRLSESQMDSHTVLLAWPETAIAQDMDERDIRKYSSITQVRNFLKQHPNIKLITGINSFTEYLTEKEKSPTARPIPGKNAWYDIFNTALSIDTSSNYEFYHKSRLVPGVEIIPFQNVLGFLNKLAIENGGASGSLGSQKEPSVFKVNAQLICAPVICYESIFGEYVSQYIAKGANVITIITNDGWWGNTPGYQQHLAYARLRAIENRKFIVRSANTGVSCFILPSGVVMKPTKYWVEAAIKSPLILDNTLTFYTKHGDYLGRIAKWLSLGFLLYYIFLRLRKKDAITESDSQEIAEE